MDLRVKNHPVVMFFDFYIVDFTLRVNSVVIQYTTHTEVHNEVFKLL